MTPDEWKRRYVARLRALTGMPEGEAISNCLNTWDEAEVDWASPEQVAEEEAAHIAALDLRAEWPNGQARSAVSSN